MIWWASPQENTLAAGSRDQTIHIFDTSSSSKAALRQLKGRLGLWAKRNASCGGSSGGEGKVVFELTPKTILTANILAVSQAIQYVFERYLYLDIQTHDIYISSFGIFEPSFGSMLFLNASSIHLPSKASEATLAQWLTCSAVQMVAFWWQTPRMARLKGKISVRLGSARILNIPHAHTKIISSITYKAQYGWGNSLGTTVGYPPKGTWFYLCFLADAVERPVKILWLESWKVRGFGTRGDMFV